MDEIGVINILKRYISKNTERERERERERESDKISSVFIKCCDLVTFSTFLAWSKLYV